VPGNKGPDYEDIQAKKSQQLQGNHHLLVIAIDGYAHCPTLSNCVRDAKAFVALMHQQYSFKEEHTYELYNEKATRKNILTQLKQLRQKISKNDHLLLYFSGHGEVVDEEAYWIPVEGESDEEADWVTATQIKKRLNFVKAFHILLIVDACFSGSFFLNYKSATRSRLGNLPSRLGLSASHSRERALDGQAGENSPFAHELLKVLRHNQQALAVDELFVKVSKAVHAATAGKQTPVLKNIDVKGDEQGQYIFIPKADESGAWEQALATDTIASYFLFMRQFPNSAKQADASAAIKRLEEQQHWERTKKARTISACLDFLSKFPDGIYAKEAYTLQEQILAGYEVAPPSPPPIIKKTSPPPNPPTQSRKRDDIGTWRYFYDGK
jgi:uncharacterized caspase-like protein